MSLGGNILRTFFAIAVTSLGVSPLSAWAETNCLPAKDLVNMVQSFYQADADRVDVIKPEVSLQLKPIGSNPAPSGLRYVYEDQKIDLLVDEEGRVQEMKKASSFNKDGQLCKLVDGEIVGKSDEPTIQANMSFTFTYLNKSGTHRVDELVEGAKDGSKVMNTLAPGGMGFMVPSLKAIIVSPAEKNGDLPVLRFMNGETLTRGPKITQVGNNQLFKVKDLKKSSADHLEVSGSYRLVATFDFDPEELGKEEAKVVESAK